jgi:hypothetical protein
MKNFHNVGKPIWAPALLGTAALRGIRGSKSPLQAAGVPAGVSHTKVNQEEAADDDAG